MLSYIILILVFLFILYLLLLPIVIVIDTISDQYYVHLKGLAKANVIADEKELFKIKLKVFFFNFSFYPLKKKKTTLDGKSKEKRVKKKSGRRVKFKTGLRVLKSFKIKQFYLNLDTGDCICNAKLYPIVAFLNHYEGNFHINYQGSNQLVLVLENRPIRIIKSFINI